MVRQEEQEGVVAPDDGCRAAARDVWHAALRPVIQRCEGLARPVAEVAVVAAVLRECGDLHTLVRLGDLRAREYRGRAGAQIRGLKPLRRAIGRGAWDANAPRDAKGGHKSREATESDMDRSKARLSSSTSHARPGMQGLRHFWLAVPMRRTRCARGRQAGSCCVATTGCVPPRRHGGFPRASA